jgi:hypothetical protein
MRSQLEVKIDKVLKASKIDFGYETEKLPYSIPQNYIPDFILGNGIYLEAKGYLSPDDRRKMIQVKREHPDKDIRFVFQNPFQRLTKNSPTSYARWCEKHGFPYCSYQAIPASWLKTPLNDTSTQTSTST